MHVKDRKGETEFERSCLQLPYSPLVISRDLTPPSLQCKAPRPERVHLCIPAESKRHSMADVVDAPVQVTAEQLGVQARYVCALCISLPGVCSQVLPLVTNTSARLVCA